LEDDGVLYVFKGEEARVLVDDGLGGEHFCVEEGVAGEETEEGAEVAVRVVDHGGDRNGPVHCSN
jgi:hypothetical protein